MEKLLANLELVRPWFAAALEDDPRPLLTVAELERDLTTGARDARLWMGERCALVTRFDDYENGQRVMLAGPAGGDLREIIGAVPELIGFAQSNGATQIMVESSEAWVRLLAPHGFKRYLTITRKIL